MRRSLFALPFALSLAGAASAQDAGPLIQLRVLATSNAPIASAEVRLVGTRVQARTDAAGRAALPIPAAGPYLLQLDAPGRTTIWRGVTIEAEDGVVSREILWAPADVRGAGGQGNRVDLAARLGAGATRLVASSEDLGAFRSFSEAGAALVAAADAPACVRNAVDGHLVPGTRHEYVYTGPSGVPNSGLPQFGPGTAFLALPYNSGLTGATAPGPNYDLLGPGQGGRSLPGMVPTGVRRPAVFLSSVAVVEFLPAEVAAKEFRRLEDGCAVLQVWTAR